MLQCGCIEGKHHASSGTTVLLRGGCAENLSEEVDVSVQMPVGMVSPEKCWKQFQDFSFEPVYCFSLGWQWLSCSTVPVALPCDDLCVLNKHSPGYHLGIHLLWRHGVAFPQEGRSSEGFTKSLVLQLKSLQSRKSLFCTKNLVASAVLTQDRQMRSCHTGEMGTHSSP